MEQPIYLSEEAQRFSGNIRVWRPISPLQQIAGFQAALQHIPSHPRFYVVSPCHATAKIWKTVYDGSDTVFVYPQKIDTQGEAANYCYADNKLINAYTTIWFVGDVLTAVETVFSGGTSLFAKVWKITDPVTVGQILAEAAISWPGMPYETLDFKIMSSTKGPEIIERLKTG
jgi:CMP-N-acetylneuraminic acid synthetase